MPRRGRRGREPRERIGSATCAMLAPGHPALLIRCYAAAATSTSLPSSYPSRLPPELPTFRTLCFDGIGGQGRSKKRVFIFTAGQVGGDSAARRLSHHRNCTLLQQASQG